MKRNWKTPVGAALGAGAAVAAYLGPIRRWHMRWGATDEEIARKMPLDDEVSKPTYVTNRAITIRALPEEVWPWIAQMGELPRGGFYSFVTVERLMKLKVKNADRILPEFQNLRVGEALDRAGTMLVKAVEPNRFLVLGPPPMPNLKVTWTIALYPTGDGSTRLISRCRAWIALSLRGLFLLLLLDPGQLLMERRMLGQVKKRVERATCCRPVGKERLERIQDKAANA